MGFPQTFLSNLSYLNNDQIQLKNHRWQIFYFYWQFSVQFSYSVMSDSLWPHGLQHARPSGPSPTPEVYSNSCPLSQWYHSTISSSVIPFSSHLQSFPASGFSNKSVLRIRWPKYWSFSFSIIPSIEHTGLTSFRMDWLDLLAVQGTLKTLKILLQYQKQLIKSIDSSALSFLYSPTLTSIHDYWKNNSFDSMDLCWQSNVSAF